MTVFAASFYASPPSSDGISIDPNFNVNVRTNSFGPKSANVIKVLPDDKVLLSGTFNTYNGQPVSGLIRLNPNGSLDSTFNNNLFAANSFPWDIHLLNDGKILVSGGSLILNGQTESTSRILRLNADGTIDPTFNYSLSGGYSSIVIDPNGQILLLGEFQFNEDGAPVTRYLIRLNDDGSHDSSFKFKAEKSLSYLAFQNNKIIAARSETINNSPARIISRLNEDGTTDESFPEKNLGPDNLWGIIVQPDNKILALNEKKLFRLNEDGSDDSGFQITNIPETPRKMHLSNDGRVVVVYGTSSNPGATFIRRMPNGTADPTFTNYTYRDYLFGAFGVQSDGSILIGENNAGFGPPTSVSAFIRLQSNGTIDSGFNPGGNGFFTIFPGDVRAITVQSDKKTLIAGTFDKIDGVSRYKIARLNPDTTVDTSFEIQVGGAGNRFSRLQQIYSIRQQADGKLVLSGNFDYYLNGVQKQNIVRLNADGSIDSSFILSVSVSDFSGVSVGGKNRFVFQPDGKIFIGGSRHVNHGNPIARRFNTDGSVDNTFNSTIFPSHNAIAILDVAIQPDGKILIGGYHVIGPAMETVTKSFLIRLNSDGSIDHTFQMPEETNREINSFRLLENGKILVVKGIFVNPRQNTIHRLHSDGSIDDSFNSGSGITGTVGDLLVLPDGKIMIGGKFSAFNGQTRHNLVKLNEDGSLNPTVYEVNDEIFSLTLDHEQRILLGGKFTSLRVNGGENINRLHAARLIESFQSRKTRFDFDGDGGADLAVFAQSTGHWSILRSSINQPLTTKFGTDGDKTTAADFDGDGKTDFAVYRPSDGNWYLLQSTAGFTAFRWGAAEDKAVPADFDGDGKADIAVYRPSSGSWFVYQSSNNQLFAVNFGLSTDIPLTDADFDGDGRADIAVWRPSNGVFYWLASASNNQFNALQFGQEGDIPAVADYNGDGKDDFVVFRPSTGIWFQNLTTADGGYTFSAVQFGLNGDLPVAADYDGDGKTDIAVRRNEVWHILKSGQGYSGLAFGSANAQAVAALQN